MMNKRYKDIFNQYIYKGEPTPFSIGTLVVCALCFLMLIVATFTQVTISHPWISYNKLEGFHYTVKSMIYNPQILAMLLSVYILGKNYSYVLFVIYLLVGFFIWPIFAFGGGIDYIQNYLFGYVLGFVFATLIAGTLLKIGQNIKVRILSAVAGVITIHLTGILYCIILAIFRVIDFSYIVPIVRALSGEKLAYDLIFSIFLLIIAPYIKNVLWTCMKPKPDRPKLKKYSHKKRDNQLSR